MISLRLLVFWLCLGKFDIHEVFLLNILIDLFLPQTGSGTNSSEFRPMPVAVPVSQHGQCKSDDNSYHANRTDTSNASGMPPNAAGRISTGTPNTSSSGNAGLGISGK